jgi:sulfate adenylyltransferase subunit 1
MVCWFNERKLIPRGKYVIRHTSADARCMVTGVQYKMDINSLEQHEEDKEVGMNDIAKINLRVTKPLHVDSYSNNRITGSVILVDEGTNETVAAGMII